MLFVEFQPNKDHKLLSQMEFDDNQQLNVRIVSTLSVSSFSATQVSAYMCLICFMLEPLLLNDHTSCNLISILLTTYNFCHIYDNRVISHFALYLDLITFSFLFENWFCSFKLFSSAPIFYGLIFLCRHLRVNVVFYAKLSWLFLNLSPWESNAKTSIFAV